MLEILDPKKHFKWEWVYNEKVDRYWFTITDIYGKTLFSIETYYDGIQGLINCSERFLKRVNEYKESQIEVIDCVNLDLQEKTCLVEYSSPAQES
jgi:hypothetical protein